MGTGFRHRGSTAWVLIRRRNSSFSRSIAVVVRAASPLRSDSRR